MTNRNGADSVVLHVPHSSTKIPRSRRQDIVLSDAELDAEILRVTDWYTDELFQLSGAKQIRFPVSRLVVDPERFSEDEQEPQATVGRGVIYTVTTHGDVLRNDTSPETRTSLLDEYYYPHHSRLTASVKKAIKEHGRCLIIDCHSFPEKPLPYELDADGERLDICIGTDSFHTPKALLDTVQSCFHEYGYETSVNTPFSGSLVPTTYYQRNEGVESIMIEVNRSLYMNEKTGERNTRYHQTRRDLSRILEKTSVHFSDTSQSKKTKINSENSEASLAQWVRRLNNRLFDGKPPARVVRSSSTMTATFVPRRRPTSTDMDENDKGS